MALPSVVEGVEVKDEALHFLIPVDFTSIVGRMVRVHMTVHSANPKNQVTKMRSHFRTKWVVALQIVTSVT